MRRAALVVVAGALSGCGASAFRCTDDMQCGPGARCEIDVGYCSFEATECGSGYRYDPRAPEDFANVCVSESVSGASESSGDDDPAGSGSASGSTGTTEGPGSTSAIGSSGTGEDVGDPSLSSTMGSSTMGVDTSATTGAATSAGTGGSDSTTVASDGSGTDATSETATGTTGTEIGPPPPCFENDATDDVVDPEYWRPIASVGASVTEQGGQVILSLAPNLAGGQARLESVESKPRAGLVLEVEIDGIDAPGAIELEFGWASGTDRISFFMRNGFVFARSQQAGAPSDQSQQTYAPATHRFLRIREQGGLVFWENAGPARQFAPVLQVATPGFVLADLASIFVVATPTPQGAPGQVRLRSYRDCPGG